jgi:hypothetical protein
MEFKFSQVLHDCILDVLENVQSESCVKIIIFYVESGQYVDDPSEFHINLHVLLGSGANVLEKMIVKELFRRLNIPYEERGDFDFARYVNEAGELFLKMQKAVKLIQ